MKKDLKTLNHYFEVARTRPLVLSAEEVKTLVQQPVSLFNSGRVKNTAHNITFQKVVVASYALTMVALFFTLWNGLASSSLYNLSKINRNTAYLIEKPGAIAVKPERVREKHPLAQNTAGSILSVVDRPVLKTTSSQQANSVPAENKDVDREQAKVAAREYLKNTPVAALPLIQLVYAVKTGTTAKTNLTLLNPNTKELFSEPLSVVAINTETAKKLGFLLDENGIHYEMEAPLGIEHLTGRKPNKLKIEVINNIHSLTVVTPPGIITNDKGIIKETKAHSITKYQVLAKPRYLVKEPALPYPLFVSDTAGLQRVKYMLGNEDIHKIEPEYFNEIINSLVPVLVKANNAAHDQALFWFQLSETFLAALPDSQREELSTVYKKVLPKPEGSAILPSRDRKNISRINVGPIQKNTKLAKADSPSPQLAVDGPADLKLVRYVNLFPNPAAGAVNLDVRFRQKETFIIYLTDISGRLVKVLKPMQMATALAIRYNFSLSGIAPGMYVVVLESKEGYKITQRLLVQ